MALGGCYTCLKYLMFVFNFIFWLVGCSLLAVGIWAKVEDSSLEKLVQDPEVVKALSVLAYVIIALGSIVMVLGFLGCCGAIRESQCMLVTFFILLFIIFSALLAIGIYTYVYIKPNEDTLKNGIRESLSSEVLKYNVSESAKQHLDALRDEYNCCGSVKGDMKARYGDAVCIGPNKHESVEGCASVVFEISAGYFKRYFVVIVGVAFGIAVIMLLGMIFSLLLCCAIRESV